PYSGCAAGCRDQMRRSDRLSRQGAEGGDRLGCDCQGDRAGAGAGAGGSGGHPPARGGGGGGRGRPGERGGRDGPAAPGQPARGLAEPSGKGSKPVLLAVTADKLYAFACKQKGRNWKIQDQLGVWDRSDLKVETTPGKLATKVVFDVEPTGEHYELEATTAGSAGFNDPLLAAIPPRGRSPPPPPAPTPHPPPPP